MCILDAFIIKLEGIEHRNGKQVNFYVAHCRKAIPMEQGHFYVHSFACPSDAIRQFDDHVRLFRQFGADEMQLVFNSIYLSISVGVTSNEMSFSWIAVSLNYFWFQFHIQNIYVHIEFHFSVRQIEAAIYFLLSLHLCLKKEKWNESTFLLKLDFRSWTIYLKRKIQSLCI